jgi:hypothetical protein
MKSDLPRLMRERDLDALVIFGSDGFGPANAPFMPTSSVMLTSPAAW